jgi:hypothetical protein
MERNLDSFAAQLANEPEGFAGLLGRKGYMVLLPLLEWPYTEVSERLLPSFVAVGIPEDEVQAVSLRALVGFAIEWPSPYWAGLAVAWLEAGFPLDRELAEALDRRVAEKHGWPQRLRHQAFRIVRRWQRQQEEA